MRHMTLSMLAVLALGSLGCGDYKEGLNIENITGKVIIPVEAATRTFLRADGQPDTITDPALIGPVYLGLFSGVAEGMEAYPHPLRGPQFQDGIPGDTYPYGGTTVGDFRYACMEYLTCKVVSGRFVDFDDLVNWFANVLEAPITDADGEVVTNGDYIRQTCYQYLQVTSDEELRVTATDTNLDGVIDENDLDFVLDPTLGENGAYVADFIIWQQEFFDNPEANPGESGFSLWGWMDAPSTLANSFATCDSTQGYRESTYNADFYSGKQWRDLLNNPSARISKGDWVACGDRPKTDVHAGGGECKGAVITDPLSTDIELWIDYGVDR